MGHYRLEVYESSAFNTDQDPLVSIVTPKFVPGVGECFTDSDLETTYKVKNVRHRFKNSGRDQIIELFVVHEA